MIRIQKPPKAGDILQEAASSHREALFERSFARKRRSIRFGVANAGMYMLEL
jgi:hypothetical protein